MIISTPSDQSEPQVGGKARGLLALKEKGHQVPDFLVLPAQLFEVSTQTIQSKEEAQQLSDKTALFELHDSFKTQLLEEIKSWGFPEKAVAIRSSVVDEDGSQHSFAGLMDSLLHIQSEEALWKGITQVAASAFSDRALDYREHHGLPLSTKPAVIVQKQVEAKVSGVMFTTFPDYPQETAIHAIPGYGEALVQGEALPEENYWLKESGQLHRQVLLEEQPESQPVLSADQGQTLFEIGQQLEKELGRPQDVEFVIDAQKVWIVQSRPITQPIPEIVVYDNSNIQESYCGVTTPLTYSFASRAYATVYRQTMRSLGLKEAVVAAKEPIVQNLLGLVKGRIYYNINNWYQGLLLLPKFSQNKADMERMMGLTEPVDFVEDQEKSWSEKLSMLPSLATNLFRLMKAFKRLDSDIEAFRKNFKKVFDWFYEQHLDELVPEQLLTIKEKLDKELLENWSVPIVNDFFVMMHNGKVARHLERLGIEEVEEFQSRLMSGDQQMENMDPATELLGLARQAGKHLQATALIMGGKTTQLAENAPEFHDKVKVFIHQYGDRTVGELKLETRTMRVDESVFFAYLKNFLKTEADLHMGAEDSIYQNAERELMEALATHALKKGKVLKAIGQLRKGIRNREALRMERTRLFGMYRSLYRTLGSHYTQIGLLNAVEDIFWLEESEIWSGKTNEWTAKVKDRRLEFEAYEKEEVPSRVIEPSPPLKDQRGDEEIENELKGNGCYPGVVDGECVVITTPDGDLDVEGKIIVAQRTDPGWAALFPICKGVLIEKGSSLSHSVILLRELGIPTIINIPRLTRRLETGQHIKMNGKTGKIEIVA